MNLRSFKESRIVNPIENGANVTSRKRAQQFIDARRAVFVGANLFCWVRCSETRRAVYWYESVDRSLGKTGVGHHGSEIANIPVVRPSLALRQSLLGRSKRSTRRFCGKTGRVRLVPPEILLTQGSNLPEADIGDER